MALRSKQAYGALARTLRALRKEKKPGTLHAALLDAIREYLGSRLRMPAAALTFADVAERLEQGGVDGETLSGLKRIFERCEAGSYAGGAASGTDDATALVEETLAVIARLERVLKRRN